MYSFYSLREYMAKHRRTIKEGIQELKVYFIPNCYSFTLISVFVIYLLSATTKILVLVCNQFVTTEDNKNIIENKVIYLYETHESSRG